MATDEQLNRLESRVQKLELANAVDQERHSTIVRRLDKIDSHVSKLVWLIVTAIVGAFMAFLVSGGLNVG